MAFKSFFSFLILSITAAQASPVVQIRESSITLPIATHINITGGALALIEADRARLIALLSQAGKKDIVPVTNTAVTYVCKVGVGKPPTQYTLLVDTGSSNTWVGAAKPYVATATSHKTSYNVSVLYGSGNFSGTEYTDTVTLGSAAITAQSIGVASNATGFDPAIDGILGIGPKELTLHTLSPDHNQTIPTVTDNLKSQHLISTREVAISFEPTTEINEVNGQLDFGGTDSTKYTGYINYVPLSVAPPVAHYWGISQSISYGPSSKVILPLSNGIVDTGSTLLFLATKSFNLYVSTTGGKPDSATGLIELTKEQFDKLESLFFHIGGVTYEYTANAQIWPRHLNTLIGGDKDAVYLAVADSGPTQEGIDFINGYVWLQRFYTVYNSDTKQMGFANTPYTHATTN